MRTCSRHKSSRSSSQRRVIGDAQRKHQKNVARRKPSYIRIIKGMLLAGRHVFKGFCCALAAACGGDDENSASHVKSLPSVQWRLS
jgi:hypothetical protein